MAESGEQIRTKRRAFIGTLAAASAALAAHQTGVLGALGEATERVFETQDQKNARKKLLEAVKEQQTVALQTIKEARIRPQVQQVLARPGTPDEQIGWLKEGEVLPLAIKWEGGDPQGRKRESSWYAFPLTGDSNRPLENRRIGFTHFTNVKEIPQIPIQPVKP